MHASATFRRLFLALIVAATVCPRALAQFALPPPPPPPVNWLPKLDPLLQQRASLLSGQSRVIVRAVNTPASYLIAPIVQWVGGTPGRSLSLIDGLAAIVPNVA